MEHRAGWTSGQTRHSHDQVGWANLTLTALATVMMKVPPAATVKPALHAFGAVSDGRQRQDWLLWGSGGVGPGKRA